EGDEASQPDRRHRRVDRPLVAELDEQRQGPAVIEVRVGQHDGIERRRVMRGRYAVPNGLVGQALEEAAIDEDLGPARLEQVLRAGDGGGATKERQVRHASWLPPAT